ELDAAGESRAGIPLAGFGRRAGWRRNGTREFDELAVLEVELEAPCQVVEPRPAGVFDAVGSAEEFGPVDGVFEAEPAERPGRQVVRRQRFVRGRPVAGRVGPAAEKGQEAGEE